MSRTLSRAAAVADRRVTGLSREVLAELVAELRPPVDRLIDLTCAEVRRLLTASRALLPTLAATLTRYRKLTT